MKMPDRSKVNLLKTDFKRMDIMLKSFKRIGHRERAWFIQRLQSDHFKLMEQEHLAAIKQSMTTKQAEV